MQRKQLLIWLSVLLGLITIPFTYRFYKTIRLTGHKVKLELVIWSDETRFLPKQSNKVVLSNPESIEDNIEILTKPIATDTFGRLTIDVPGQVFPSRISYIFSSGYKHMRIQSLSVITPDGRTTLNATQLADIFIAEAYIDTLLLDDNTIRFTAFGPHPTLVTKPEKAKLIESLFAGNTSDKPIGYALLTAILLASIIHFCLGVSFPPNPNHQETRTFDVSRWLFPLIFILLLGLPLLYKTVEPKGDGKMADNRTKRGFPKPKAETILTYPPRLSGFLDDDFGGRDFLIQTNSWLKADLLGVSTNREVVEIGKDDWLVYVEDEVREAVLREVYFTPDQLKQIRKMLVERQQWLRLRGCSFYLLVAPMSSYIYPEILPPGLVSCKPKNGLTTLLNFLKTTTDLHIIEPDSLLLAAKKHFDLYYKRDTHWNDVGAYIAYKDVISNIKQEFPAISPSLPLDRFRFTLPNYLGDLDRMLGVSESFKRPSIRLSLKQKNYTVVNETQNLSGIKHLYGSVHQYQHNLSPKLPKLYMNHDSYGDFLIEYLSEHFGQSTYEFVRAFEPESIEKYNPDIVIWEFVNRMASGLPKLRNARIENDLKAHGIIIDDAYFNRFNKTN